MSDEQQKERASNRRAAILELARSVHGREGAIEFDDDAGTSEGNDNGAYVSGWVWVEFGGTELTKEPDDPSLIFCTHECTCHACGFTYFEGDKAVAVPDTDKSITWYCPTCLPKDVKLK